MKYIVKTEKAKNEGKIVIDFRKLSRALQEFSLEDILKECLPYTKIFEKITVMNMYNIPEILVSLLTNQYLHGAEITFIMHNKEYTYKAKKPQSFYTYKWIPLDLTAPVNESLAKFKFKLNGVETTYIEAIKNLKNPNYLPNDLWKALDIYSRERIDRCREYNKGNYAAAETWFKTLMKDAMHEKIKMYSPNTKTYFEALAETKFEYEVPRLYEGEKPLTQEQLLFLNKYAAAYGVSIPKFEWKYNSRKTKHGWTSEPERVYNGMSEAEWNQCLYDSRNTNNLPGFVRKGLITQAEDNDKLLKEAYDNLMYLISNLGDEALMPGYKRCPHCGEIYKESEGCLECGKVEPLVQIQANNLFYGDASDYEDYEYTHDVIFDTEEYGY